VVQFRLHCALAGVLVAPPLPTHVFKQNIAALSHVIVQMAFADCCGSKITGGGGARAGSYSRGLAAPALSRSTDAKDH
jgi:hypothetical protein